MQKEKFYELLINPALLSEETLPELQQLTDEYPFFQTAWMLYLKNLKETGDPGFDAALNKAALRVPDRKQLHRFLTSKSGMHENEIYFEQSEIPTHDYHLDNDEKHNEGDSLIDKFLSSSRDFIKMKNEPGESTLEETENEILAKSEAEDDELVTETLAMIYFEQKKYDKALDAFKKLSLKFPEKNVYFASRIEEIEKLKNI